MSGELTGKVALITGAASGIGRATALLLAANGAAIVVADIQEAGGGETVQLIEAAGGQATFFRADVTDREQVDAMVQHAVETYGGLDILHANAGHPGYDKALVDHSDEEWDLVMAINLTGVFRCCRAAIPALAERGGGYPPGSLYRCLQRVQSGHHFLHQDAVHGMRTAGYPGQCHRAWPGGHAHVGPVS
jgi:NAD(P)-dependent dehydrogenase (short-subunit alcohol dehydrogenase family)